MRVVLDTNVIVSRYLSARGVPARILERWEAGAFTLLISEPILAEYHETLGCRALRVRHLLQAERIDRAIANFRRSGTMIETTDTLRVVENDPDDDRIIECALAGSADYIVSGDSHLLDLREFRGIRILSPAAFLAMLENEGR